MPGDYHVGARHLDPRYCLELWKSLVECLKPATPDTNADLRGCFGVNTSTLSSVRDVGLATVKEWLGTYTRRA
jgi:hypothetical protein